MNKLVKGSIAGAAGIILLMGGAGSLAYWNDTANAGPAGGSTITAGTLTVTAQTAGSWTKGMYNNAGTQTVAPAAVANLSNVRLVPGNRLVYTQVFNVVGIGDDLFFTVGSTNGAVTAASAGAADTALAAAINGSGTTAFTVGTVTGGTVVAATTPGVYRVSSNAGTAATITVTWTINVPFGAGVDNASKGGVVNLSQGSITLTQVAAP